MGVFWRTIYIFWWISTRIYAGSARSLSDSSQHRHASVHSHTARWTSAVHHLSVLIINSRVISQPSGPSNDTAQSNKPMHILVEYHPPQYAETRLGRSMLLRNTERDWLV